jgi:hypothetical protein
MIEELLRFRNANAVVGIRWADYATPSIRKKVESNFFDKRLPPGRYSSLAD